MMAASARTSGTTLPVSSSLKRGSMASRRAAAWTAALARAPRTRRLLTVGFFVVAVVVAFLTAAGLATVETVFRADAARTAALDCTGRPMAATAARKKKSREAAAHQLRITGKPLCPRLLRNVSAL